MILARGVGRAVQDAAVGQADLDRPAGHRRAVLVPRDQVGLDRLAAVEHGLLQVEAQVDRLELVRLDLETARRSRSCPAGRPVTRYVAHRRGRVERQRLVERAEFRERDRPGDDQPAAAVGDLEAVDRLGHVGVLAVARPRGPRRGSRPSGRADRPAGRCRCRRERSAPARPGRGRPGPSRRRAGRRGRGSSVGRCRRAAGFQSRSRTPSCPVVASSTTWPPSATRTRGAGAASAGLHVLGEDQDLIARAS